MGNCLEYFCQSSGEDKKEDLTVKKNEEKQIPNKPAEIPRENREFVSKRSERSALPSVDIDLPVLKLIGEPKIQTKSSVQHQDGEKPDVAGEEAESSGLETFFFQSSLSSVQSCTLINDKEKVKELAISSPKQIYKNKKIEDGIMINEKRKKSMRQKLHLPKIKLKSLRKSRKCLSTDDVINDRLPLSNEDECEVYLRRLKPLGVARSEMPRKAMMVDDIFVTVHQLTPKTQFVSSEEAEEGDLQSPLPPSLRQTSWKEMYKQLIKEKEVAANKRLETQPKAAQKENSGKTRTRRRTKRSRAKRKPQLSSSDEEMASGLPLFRGCDVLVSTHAVLVEVEDTGYLASGEESD